ncbi:MAG: polysaccharide pyruvyl transferase family protein [Bacillota bacterium]
MKKVMLYAYTNFNLGDDLFIKIICERYPNTKFVLSAPRKYKVSFKKIKNLSCYSYDSKFSRLINSIFRKLFKVNNISEKMIIKSCDAGVHIGGSVFIQNDNWQEYFEKNTKLKKIKNKPFYLLGTNFGPYYEKEYYNKHKEIFREYTDICFREKYSYEMFKDLPNVRMADDIIFQIKRDNNNIQESENSIVISVIKPSIRKYLSDYDEIYYKKIKEIAIHFIGKGLNVNFVSFCENEGDNEAIDNIVNLIPKEYLDKVTKHYYALNIDETLKLIAASKFVVATRFHSMILGWVYNKPVLPIIYSKKMTNVIEDVGFNGFYADIKNISTISPNKVYECMYTNIIDVSKQKTNAEKHFEKLDEYLID